MTLSSAKPKIIRKIVVIFDICSSTSILEDLIRTENQAAWQRVLTQMKKYLWEQGLRKQMYKFLGDGWILLFDDDEISAELLIQHLEGLCAKYDQLFQNHVASVLSNMPTHVGLTFGIDEGSLVAIVMNQQTEYVGRAINVAARLQSAIKSIPEPPPGVLLISGNAFARTNLRVRNEVIECNLANVTGGAKYRARKIRIAEIDEGAV
jgi:class 3 adenylate cyclase